MRISKTFLAASIAAFGLLGQPMLSQAYDGEHGGHGKHGARSCRHADGDALQGPERMAKRLHLSPEQRQSMRAVEEKYRPQMRDLRQNLTDNRQALAKLGAGDPKFQELADTQGKSIARMIVLRKQMRAEIDPILTEPQRQQLERMLEHRRHHGEHGEHGDRGRG
jgi:Spy/CpxP family protein refolding chaperone